MLHTMPTSPTSKSLESFSRAAAAVVGAANKNNLVASCASSSKRIYYCQRCLNHARLAPRKNHKAECIYSQCDCEKCILVERRRVLNIQLQELEELEEQPEQPANSKLADILFEGEEQMHCKSSPLASARSSLLSSAAQSPLSTSSVLLAPADSTINDLLASSQQEQKQSLCPSSAFSLSNSGLRLNGERVPQCQKCSQHGRKIRLKGHKRFCAFKDCACPKCQVITERQKLMADQIKIRRRQSKDTWIKLRRQRLPPEVSLTTQPSLFEEPSPFSNNYLSQLNQFYKNITSSCSHLASTTLSDYTKSNSQSNLFDNPFLSSSIPQNLDYPNLNQLIAEKQREVIAQMLGSTAFQTPFAEPVDFSAASSTGPILSPKHTPPSCNQSIMDALLAKMSEQQQQREELSPPACSCSPATNLLTSTSLMLSNLPVLTSSPHQFNFSADGCPVSVPSEEEAYKNRQVSPPCLWPSPETSLTPQQLMLLQLLIGQQNSLKTEVEEQKKDFNPIPFTISGLFSQEQIQQLLNNSLSQ